MTSPFLKPGENIQRSQRVYRTFTDQHGREFACWADIRNGSPIEELRPVGFAPPWLPPMGMAKFTGEHQVRFRWDYETLANEFSELTSRYYDDAIKIALDHNITPVPDLGGPVDRRIRAVLGTPPMSPAIPLACEMGDPWILGVPGAPVNEPLEAVLRQKQGAHGKEVLDAIREALRAKAEGREMVQTLPEPVAPKAAGVKTIHDIDLDAAVEPVTYKAFFAACRRKGMSAPDIAAAWHEQKLLQAVA